MSVRDVDRAVVAEARKVLCNPRLRLKDLAEWRTTAFEPPKGADEVVIELDVLDMTMWAAFYAAADKRPKSAAESVRTAPASSIPSAMLLDTLGPNTNQNGPHMR